MNDSLFTEEEERQFDEIVKLREVGHGEMGLYIDYQSQFAKERMGLDQAAAQAYALRQARDITGSYEFAGLKDGLEEVELVRNSRLKDTQLHDLVGKYADSLGATAEQRATLMKHFGDKAHGIAAEQWREHQSKGTGPISDMNRMLKAADAYRQGFEERLTAAGLSAAEVKAEWQRQAGEPDSLVARMLDGRVQNAAVIRDGMGELDRIGAQAEYERYQEGFSREKLGYAPQEAAEYARARADKLAQGPDLAGLPPTAHADAAKLIRAALAREQVLHAHLDGYADALGATAGQRALLMGKYADLVDGIAAEQWQEHERKGTGPIREIDNLTSNARPAREEFVRKQQAAGLTAADAQAAWPAKLDQIIRGGPPPAPPAAAAEPPKAGERLQLAEEAGPRPAGPAVSNPTTSTPAPAAAAAAAGNRVNPTSGPAPAEGEGPTAVTPEEIEQAMKQLHSAIMSHKEGQMSTILDDGRHSELSKAYYTARHLAAGGDGFLDADESEAFVAAYEAANGKGSAAIAREAWQEINVAVSENIALNAEIGFDNGGRAAVQTNLAVLDKNGDRQLDDDDKKRITGFLRQSGVPEEKLNGLLKQVSDAVNHESFELSHATDGGLDPRSLPYDGPSPLVQNRGSGRGK